MFFLESNNNDNNDSNNDGNVKSAEHEFSVQTVSQTSQKEFKTVQF